MSFTIGPEYRGADEFVRLALEVAGASCRRCGRKGGGEGAMLRSSAVRRSSICPSRRLSQRELIIGPDRQHLAIFGARHCLAPIDEAGRCGLHQLQLTIADLVTRFTTLIIRLRAASITKTRVRKPAHEPPIF